MTFAPHSRRLPASAVRSRLLAPMLAVLLVAAGAQARAADLELEVSGFTASSATAATAADSGMLMVAVFDAQGWLRKPVAVDRQSVSAAKDGKLVLRLTGLPDVPIAVSVFQDLNGNGKLDMNPMGMPIEPFAFSRQAQGNFGPPSFEQAVLPAGTARHEIRLPAQ